MHATEFHTAHFYYKFYHFLYAGSSSDGGGVPLVVIRSLGLSLGVLGCRGGGCVVIVCGFREQSSRHGMRTGDLGHMGGGVPRGSAPRVDRRWRGIPG